MRHGPDKNGIRRLILAVFLLTMVLMFIPTQRTEANFWNSDPSTFSDVALPVGQAEFNEPGEFRFITPIAPNPHDPAADLDTGMLQYLNVSVCRVDTVAPCKSFDWQGPMSERLRVMTSPKYGSYFIANWDTSGFALDNGVYRITVDAAGIFLGSVDLPPSAYKQFGRTWPIKFIVEKDPQLRAQVIQSSGGSMWEIAADLMTDLNICGEELRSILRTKFPDAPDSEIQMVVDNVCQDVIIPDSTKIADPSTRAALVSYDKETGRMVFADESPQLKLLKNGDVIVSKPAPGAPYGFLRKIRSVRKDGPMIVLETIQAKFSEAITLLGPTNVSGQLRAPATSTSASSKFSSLRSDDKTGLVVSAIDEGDSFEFNEPIHAEINFEGEEGDIEGSGKINVDGYVHFNAGYNIGLGVEGCFEVPPVCVDRVEAWAAIEQVSRLKVTGEFEGRLTKEQEIGEVPMQPIFFFIGPFPVWIQPSVEILLGVNGEARVDFTFEAGLQSHIKVGAKWTDPDDGGIGWENLSEFNPIDNEYFSADMRGKVKLEAYGKVDAKLLFYSVFGPGMNGSFGVSGDADTGRKPLWIIRGHVRSAVNIGADAGGYFDIGEVWSQDILNESFLIQEAPNLKPDCFWRTDQIPANIATEVYLGPTTGGISGGYFSCTDPEGEAVTYTATSSVGDFIPSPPSPLNVTFQTSGDRTINVTARDASGSTETFPLNIRVFNAAPDVWLDATGDSVPAGVPYSVLGRAFDLETQTFLTCDRLKFTAGPNATVIEDNSNGCGARIIFQQEGSGTIVLTATDVHGAQNTATKTLTVTTRPDNLPPVITFFEVRAFRGPASGDCRLFSIFDCKLLDDYVLFNGQTGDYHTPLSMEAIAIDPEGLVTPTIQWFCKSGNFQALVEVTGPGTATCEPALDPNYRVEVYALAFDGVSYSQPSGISLFVPRPAN